MSLNQLSAKEPTVPEHTGRPVGVVDFNHPVHLGRLRGEWPSGARCQSAHLQEDAIVFD